MGRLKILRISIEFLEAVEGCSTGCTEGGPSKMPTEPGLLLSNPRRDGSRLPLCQVVREVPPAPKHANGLRDRSSPCPSRARARSLLPSRSRPPLSNPPTGGRPPVCPPKNLGDAERTSAAVTCTQRSPSRFGPREKETRLYGRRRREKPTEGAGAGCRDDPPTRARTQSRPEGGHLGTKVDKCRRPCRRQSPKGKRETSEALSKPGGGSLEESLASPSSRVWILFPL
ncbi:uncharacterized protein LOC114813875 [Ornithorhynchus anatinus]|uniref:uncharacterized protein LOC114813875 n=1 Tax=Ornithorhynchus anatinus TaxID=9258 RepID=UPI0010A8A6CC|nr:uncharacterized protein LOC114813875 [Ornithorhynchus anatinus]